MSARPIAAIFMFVAVLAGAGAGAEENLYRLAPATLTLPDGSKLSLGSLRGRPAIINFWAPWCGPCREELPLLADAHAKRGAKANFLGIAVEDNLNSIRDFAKAYRVPYAVTGGRDAAIALLQGLGNVQAGIPYTIAVDAEGTIRYRKRGLLKADELDRLLELLGGGVRSAAADL